MSSRARHPHSSHSGFSLVEIMVGMVIGMLGIIVMMQVFSLAEGQKRTTTGGSEAQTSGAIAMYGLQRDLRQAGFGISDLKTIGCDVLLPNGLTLNSMAPVTINHPLIPAGDANTDTLLIAYGNGNGSTQGDIVLSGTNTKIYPVTTAASFSFTKDEEGTSDYVIATPWADDTLASAPPANPTKRPAQGTKCGLVLDRISTAPATGIIAVKLGVTTFSATPPYFLGPSSLIYNLGATPKFIAYAVRNGNLMRCDFVAPKSGQVWNWSDCSDKTAADNANKGTVQTLWTSLAGNIVSLRAEYGRDKTVLAASPTMNGIVDTYDQITPPTQDDTTVAANANRCGWMRIAAVRLALVGRSDQYEKTAVTVNAPTWMGSAVDGIDLSAYADWQHYRYRVFQTTVPLRNVTWQGVPAQC